MKESSVAPGNIASSSRTHNNPFFSASRASGVEVRTCTEENSKYRIFPAIRRDFRPSRMASNNLISPMKFCYNTNSTLPKQCQSSRSILQDGSRTFGLFWKEKTPSYNRRNTVLDQFYHNRQGLREGFK